MGLVDFTSLPLWLNLLIFAAGAAAIWPAGARLAGYVDRIGRRTGLGDAFLGVAMLGVATSLPELVTTITGSMIGNAPLVTGNLFGGIAMQVAILSVVDAFVVRDALTYAAPKPVLLFQGVMLLMLLAITLVGISLDDPLGFFGVGATPAVVMLVYVAMVRFTIDPRYLPRWEPTHVGDAPALQEPEDGERWSTSKLSIRVALAALTILVAGWTVASTGDAMAQQTGLGSTFVGVVLVAISTSLPELSTTITASRAGNYEMAISNILGTNCLSVALLLPADIAYRGGPVLATADDATVLAIAMGMVVTAVHLLGLLERRNKTIAGMGVDSVAILVLYGISLIGIYTLR